MVLVPEAALVARFAGASGVYPSTPMAVAAALRQHVREARRVADAEARTSSDPAGLRRVAYDPVAAALRPAVRRERPVFFVAESVLEGHRALRLGHELELDVVLAGVPEASLLTDALRARRRAVLAPLALPKAVPADTVAAADTLLVDPTRALADHLTGDVFVSERRTRSYADVEAETASLRERQRTSVGRYERSPLALHEAGVPFAFASLGVAPADVRGNLRRMIAAGLPQDAALAALTTTPAEVLGLGRSLGTVEAGRLANLVLTDGDYFAEDTRVRYVFVDGQRFEVTEASAGGAQEDPSAEVTALGTWDVTVVTPEGTLSGQMTLSGTAEALAGTLTLPQLGTFSLEDVRLAGNRLTFAVPGTPIGRAEASGLIQGTAFEGEFRAPGAPPIPITGTRRPG
jgi:imidazolonepropionase-like amidohydrolase